MPEEIPEITAAVAAALVADRERVCDLMFLLQCPDGATRSRVLTYVRNGKTAADFTAQFGAETR